jgi:glycosyltransferase involved in cell wall biosynthesis
MLSIIIPTLNEEKNLSQLLPNINNQLKDKDYEIIVADADSVDGTVQVAKKHNCKVVRGGLPARGKNQGAKYASGDLLFFLDADVVLSQDFFKTSLEEFQKRGVDIASFCLLPHSGNKLHSFLFNVFYNQPILFLEDILPHGATGILIKKDLFWKLNGFDESIKLAEDHDLSRRAVKMGKWGILRSNKIFISLRRFEKDGWLKTGLKYLLCELHMIFKGPVRSESAIFEYDFDYSSQKKDKIKLS